MLVVVDYGLGNLRSIVNMLARVGVEAIVSSNPEDIAAAERIILPGVGAWNAGLDQIDARGLRPALDEHAVAKAKPTLGICLGMQLLFERSEEGDLPGLGWLPGRVVRFPSTLGVKVPHMGWNDVQAVADEALLRERPGELLYADMEPGNSYYFVHSYYAQCERSLVRGWSNHGIEFAALVGRGNVYGAQFHPEKSHKHGMRLLQNFVERT